MPDTVNAQVVDEVTQIKTDTMATIPATVANLSIQDALIQQRRINEIANGVFQNALNAAQLMNQAVIGRVIDMTLGTAERAEAFNRTMAPLEKKLADIQASLASAPAGLSAAMLAEKTGAIGLPQTGTGGAFGSDAMSPLLQQLANNQALLAQQMAILAAAVEALKK